MRPALGLALALMIAACAPQTVPVGEPAPARPTAPAAPSRPPAPGAARSALTDTEWTLQALDHRPILAGSRVTLGADAATLYGFGGCSAFEGGYRVEGDRLRVDALDVETMGCDPAVAAQETAYFAALGRAERLTRGRDTLQLAGPGGTLSFAARPANPGFPNGLDETRWRLLTLGGRRLDAPLPFTLAFGEAPWRVRRTDTRRVHGYAGCRSYTGEYTMRGDEIAVTVLQRAEVSCPDARADAAEEAFLRALSGAARVREGRLEITSDGGRTVAVFEPDR